MKKLLSILLALVTVLCAFSGTTVFADDEYIPYHICEYEEYTVPAKLENDGYGGQHWIVGEKGQRCRTCGEKKNVEIIEKPYCTLNKDSYYYNGKQKTPKVICTKENGDLLVEGVDYTVEYTGKRIDVSRYKVKIKFLGDYSGSTYEIFSIFPKKVKIKSVQGIKNGYKISWKKSSGQFDGYRITIYDGNYKDKNSPLNRTKTVKIKNKKQTSATVKGLKRNHKYYVFVETYKKAPLDYRKRNSDTFSSGGYDLFKTLPIKQYKTK